MGFGAGLVAALPPPATTGIPQPPAAAKADTWTTMVARSEPGDASASGGPASAAAPQTAPIAGMKPLPSVEAKEQPASIQPSPAAEQTLPAPAAPAPAAQAGSWAPVVTPADPASTVPAAPPAKTEASEPKEAAAPTRATAEMPAPATVTAPETPAPAKAEEGPRSYAPADAGKESIITKSPGKPETAWVGADEGVADTDKRIAPVLALHSEHDVVLCLAGCGGPGISIVEIRRKPQVLAASFSEMVPHSSGRKLPISGDVVCLAGCTGSPGQVVFRNVRLSWINDEGSETIKTALRAIAGRLIAAEGLALEPRRVDWMPAGARSHLVEHPPVIEPHEKLAFAGPKVAGWLRRIPGVALARDDH
jgi:hypothetical protein